MGRYPKQRLATTIYLVVVDDRPIVAFRAASFSEARELIKEPWFRASLRNKRSEGVPLWDGKAKLGVRCAKAVEAVFLTKVFVDQSEASLKLLYLITNRTGSTNDSPGTKRHWDN
jgi:hypothetical protein